MRVNPTKDWKTLYLMVMVWSTSFYEHSVYLITEPLTTRSLHAGSFEWCKYLIFQVSSQAYELLSQRLFSHDGKVHILNFKSKYAFWITQCTHERSNCDIWITQCTHETPNFRFCIPAGEECLGTLPIKHAWSSHFLCFCT